MDAVDIDFDRLRDELGLAGMNRRAAAEPAFAAAWADHRRRAAQERATREIELTGYPLSLWNVAEDGRDHGPVTSIPVGPWYVVRAVGELVTVDRHWTDTGPRVCFKHECPHCPSERRRDGYFDAIATRTLPDQTEEPYRRIVSVPNAAVQFLESLDHPLRGAKVAFQRRAPRARTAVNVLEATSAWDLPPAIEIRKALIRLWNLPYWPVEKEDGSPVTLPFRRKQA